MTAGDGAGVATAGTEEYGVIVDAGDSSEAATGLTLGAAMDATNVVSYESTSDIEVLDVDGPNNAVGTETTNSATVTHQLAISPVTPSGYYNQVVTYTVTPRF